jgi:uncharacterized membrane protein (DUF2068 family)
MPRPTGVTILAILYFIGTCFLALLGIASIAGMGFLSQMLAQNPNVGSSGAAMLASAGVVLSIFSFAFALVCGFLGYGLWNLKNWARTLAMVLAIIGAVFCALGLIFAIFRFSPFGLINNGVQFGINALIVWYLNQPHVKAAFAMSGVRAVGMGGSAGAAR